MSNMTASTLVSKAVDIAKTAGLTLSELTETLNLLYGDETV